MLIELFNNLKKRLCCKSTTTIDHYIYRHGNDFHVLGRIEAKFDHADNFDYSGMQVWGCDKNMVLIYGTHDAVIGKPMTYIGKSIYEVEPKDFGQFCGTLHTRAQEEKNRICMKMLLNQRIVHVQVTPLMHDNNVVHGSILVIIPYRLCNVDEVLKNEITSI